MVLKVHYLIYGYLTLCVCMLAFNLFYIGKIKWMNVHNPQKLKWWKNIMTAVINGDNTMVSRVKIGLRLTRAQNLLLFREAVQDLVKGGESTERVAQWFQDNCRIFIDLGESYMKKGPIEKSLYAFVVGEYRLCAYKGAGPIKEYMLLLILEPSIYGRENALFAMYNSGSAELVCRAYRIMNRHEILHSRKMVTDGLVSFVGDKQSLAEELWATWEEFNPHYQVAFIDFMRMATDSFGERLLPLLSSDVLPEVKFAILRYYRRYHNEAAESILQHYVNNWCIDDWEFAAISASALENYPGEKTVKALIRGIESDNWYVRDNASDSLLKIVDLMQAEEIMLQLKDTFGRDMLNYKIEKIKNAREAQRKGGNDNDGCN